MQLINTGASKKDLQEQLKISSYGFKNEKLNGIT